MNLDKYSVVRASGNLNYNNISGKIVLTLKEVPEIIFTGLKDLLGQPREFERNLKEPEFFGDQLDISIPI